MNRREYLKLSGVVGVGVGGAGCNNPRSDDTEPTAEPPPSPSRKRKDSGDTSSIAVKTLAATAGITSARFRGELLSLGDHNSGHVSFYYREVDATSWELTVGVKRASSGEFTQLEDLSRDTKYEYKTAVNIDGDVTFGDIQQFSTRATGVELLHTQPALPDEFPSETSLPEQFPPDDDRLTPYLTVNPRIYVDEPVELYFEYRKSGGTVHRTRSETRDGVGRVIDFAVEFREYDPNASYEYRPVAQWADDTNAPDFRPVFPEIRLTEPTLQGDRVAVGETLELRTELSNTGRQPYQGEMMFVDRATDEPISRPASVEAPPGETIQVTSEIRTDSQAAGEHARSITAVTPWGDSIPLGEVTYTLGAPKLAVQTQSVDFGAITPYGSVPFEIAVKNVSEVRHDGTTSVALQNNDVGYNCATAEFDITLDPGSSETYTGELGNLSAFHDGEYKFSGETYQRQAYSQPLPAVTSTVDIEPNEPPVNSRNVPSVRTFSEARNIRYPPAEIGDGDVDLVYDTLRWGKDEWGVPSGISEFLFIFMRINNRGGRSVDLPNGHLTMVHPSSNTTHEPVFSPVNLANQFGFESIGGGESVSGWLPFQVNSLQDGEYYIRVDTTDMTDDGDRVNIPILRISTATHSP